MSRKSIGKNVAFDDAKQVFYAYFNCGVGLGGARQRFARTYPTQEEAEQALMQFRASGKYGLPTAEHITLGEWMNYWLEDIVRLNLEYTTYYCYHSIVKNHVAPALGCIRLAELTPFHIQRYYTEMTRVVGLSPNTVHKHHILLHTVLKLAFRQGVLPYNPIDRVDPPRLKPTHRLYYTPQQLKRLLQAASGTEVELVIKLAGYLGLRRGEICGLKWGDIDFQSKEIFICRARTKAGGVIVEKEPKTSNSIRHLCIAESGDLIDLLRQKRKCAVEREAFECKSVDGIYVLSQPDGTPWNPDKVTHAVSKFVQGNHFPPITVHGLRHTFASVANSAHIPLPDISKALGHKDVTITGRIYTHIFDTAHSEAVSAVARFIGEA